MKIWLVIITIAVESPYMICPSNPPQPAYTYYQQVKEFTSEEDAKLYVEKREGNVEAVYIAEKINFEPIYEIKEWEETTPRMKKIYKGIKWEN